MAGCLTRKVYLFTLIMMEYRTIRAIHLKWDAPNQHVLFPGQDPDQTVHILSDKDLFWLFV